MLIQRHATFLGLALGIVLCLPAFARGYGTPELVHLPPFVVDDFSEVSTGSSPDNSFALFTNLIDSSHGNIRLAAYMLRSPGIGEALERAARRGVKVTVLLDGWTVGKPKIEKIEPLELFLANKIVQAGGRVFYLRSDTGPRTDRRFRYLHAKYAVVDDSIFLSSENFANNGFSPTTTVGSRGWVISIRNKSFADHFSAMFDEDMTPVKEFDDIYPYGSHPDYTLPDPDYVLDHDGKSGQYRPNLGTITRAPMKLERVISPDDSLAPRRAILGAIRSAKETLEIQSLSFAAHWGKNEDTAKTNPNPITEAVLAAARRGLKVRVMVNPLFFMVPKRDPKKPDEENDDNKKAALAWHDLTANASDLFLARLPFLKGVVANQPRRVDTRDNAALIKYFRKVAAEENLDLQANFFFVKENSLRILHNKGMIVDGRKTLISSINWTENSMKNNRETAVIVDNPEVAAFYQNMFELDWKYFRNKK